MEALTLRCVAKRAGYNSATLYNYFKDLDHLTVYASMKYFEDYNRNLARYLADEQDPLQRFLFMWRFFCASAFRHQRAYYNLFYGKYSGELGEIVQTYYEVFPDELGELDSGLLEMLACGSLTERNWQMLRPVLEGEDFTPEEQEEINEIILYCFKELLTQKLQAGDALNDQALMHSGTAQLYPCDAAPVRRRICWKLKLRAGRSCRPARIFYGSLAAGSGNRSRMAQQPQDTAVARPDTYRASTTPSRSSRLSEEWLRLISMTKRQPSGTIAEEMVSWGSEGARITSFR